MKIGREGETEGVRSNDDTLVPSLQTKKLKKDKGSSECALEEEKVGRSSRSSRDGAGYRDGNEEHEAVLREPKYHTREREAEGESSSPSSREPNLDV
ncbi:hypothetical protein NE237_029041 [Protea cynaroides]|uniref:Uncharacterized protein n=1 Tax=Protea cynaroides TaxID=273540 RepID=A0A9Q0GV19_9MAGN|nr:hypothetical protein NE237_029041 [Protea cynaroides]